MTLRLAVTQEQADVIRWGSARLALVEPLTLRLPERPTMPMVDFTAWGGDVVDRTPINIPEGVEVLVVYPCPECDGKGWWSRWRDDVGYRSVKCKNCIDGSVSVAFATLTEVRVSAERDYHPKLGQLAVDVTLSDIKPVEG